mgnify:FL=1|tara:strand:- start:1517 stop:2146 length:630 start_codon:yes stop_codon:yes gene_type:complete
MEGKFIVFEGIDGCGKTTQIKAICNWLPKSNLVSSNSLIVKTREPGGSILGEKLRELILSNDKDNSPSSLTELLLYAADRAEHITKKISPALKKGDWVLSDRFSGSTLAYQGYGRNIDKEIIEKLEIIACQGEKPDITFLLDISPEESIARRKNKLPDRIESEGINFLRKVSIGFKEIAKKNNWIIISAANNQEKITNTIKNTLIEKFS